MWSPLDMVIYVYPIYEQICLHYLRAHMKTTSRKTGSTYARYICPRMKICQIQTCLYVYGYTDICAIYGNPIYDM